MDRGELSEAIIQELGEVFKAELRTAGPALLTADLDGLEHRLQQVSRRVCGVTIERVVAVRAAAAGERPPCPTCGGVLRLVERARGRQVQGLTGDATLYRPTDVCTRAACGQGFAPLDAELGVGAATLTPRLARVACRAGITEVFDTAAARLQEEHGVVLAGETVRRLSEAMGAVAEAAQQEEINRAQGGRLPRPLRGAVDLVVAVDGCQVLLEDGWHEMKVGRVAPLGPALQTDARSGRTFFAWGPSVCCAGLESAEEFWYRVYVMACRTGLSPQTRRVIVLGDGAEWIWCRAAHFVGGPGVEVIEIVDIYHAYEHLWAVGRAVFDTPHDCAAWVEPLKDALYERGAPAVLDALEALGPVPPAALELLRTTRAYFADNTARMDYPRFVAQHLPIGSGAVESLCKSLIEARLKQAGMRWTRGAAQAIATLRAVQASGQWDAFWASHPLRAHLRLCPPARPRRTRCAPAPAPEATSSALPPPAVSTPPRQPDPRPTASAARLERRPPPSHPWRRAPIGRARCA
jgi:hypothetical protein